MRTIARISYRLIASSLMLLTASSVSFAQSKPPAAKAKPAPSKAAKNPAAKSPPKSSASTARPAARKAKSPESSASAQDLGAMTRVVRVADSADSVSLGESFGLAVDAQYLILPLHFVTEMQTARKGVRFFVAEASGAGRPEVRREVYLSELDLASNLALFKSSQPLIPSLMRARIRADAPSPTEPLLTLASRDWLKPGAKLLGWKSDGAIFRYEISLGAVFDPRFSRYVFDRSGRLVAIASPERDSEVALATSARALSEMLRRQVGPKPASVNPHDQATIQLKYWQEQWAKALLPSPGKVNLHGLDCRAHQTLIKDKAAASNVRGARALRCSNLFALPLGGGYAAGLEIWSAELALKPNVDSSAERSLISAIESSFSSETFKDLNQASAAVNVMGEAVCEDASVVNQRMQKIKVRFCTAALKIGGGFNDSVFSLVTVDPGAARAFVTTARLKGFNQANSRRILQALAETVGSVR